jgi:hypothetical protein
MMGAFCAVPSVNKISQITLSEGITAELVAELFVGTRPLPAPSMLA